MLWSSLVAQVGALHRVNLVAPFPLGQNCLRKITMIMTMTMVNACGGEGAGMGSCWG